MEMPKCPTCGNDMERKFFMGGSAPIWRCKSCAYKSKPFMKERHVIALGEHSFGPATIDQNGDEVEL